MNDLLLDQTGVLSEPFTGADDSPPRIQSLSNSSTGIITDRSSATAHLPDLGPRYRPIRKLGQGGMGAVYLSEDREIGRNVAIKVLPPELSPDQHAVQRFHKEARLLAEVHHPQVANLLDVVQHADQTFLVMELVEGTDLRAVLQRQSTLPEHLALQIIGDIAAALAVAHERGIVHRDLKPANILLSAVCGNEESPVEAVFSTIAAGQPPTVKLTDFGLARHVDQGASMDLTKTGMMLGTPYYISPEQCTDKQKITPAADVYSLGATLFELLAGRPPFKSDDPIKLISMHCFEEPPDLRKLNPHVSDGAAALVAKALQKTPDARFADAGHFLSELDRLVRGEAANATIHPTVPAPTGKVFEADWEWDLDGSPAELWPWVSNTERVNAAVGLPPVEYVTRRDEQGIKHRFGSFRLGWTRLSWEEHPFEWVEGRRLGILRQFENGPFEWFVSVVELTPRPNGGSRLTHRVRIATRGLLGRLVAYLEVNIKGRKPLDKVYRRINEVVMGRLRQSKATDPFLPAAPSSASLRKKLTLIRERLAGQVNDLECLDALLEYLADSPAQDLARIRPRELARRLKINTDHLTTACLAGCHAGLLELHWDILCPTCRAAAEITNTLSAIDKHARCEACEHDFDVDFSQSVEMIFRAHPDFRQADLKTYCIGGPEHAPHVVSQVRVAPGEMLELDLMLDPGSYILRGSQLPYVVSIVADSSTGTSRLIIPLDSKQKSSRPICVHAGRQLLTLTNGHAYPLILRLERTVARTDVMTAAEAVNLPVFQKLFPTETISRTRLTNASHCTLLGLRISNALDLYCSLGDVVAGNRIRQVLTACRLTIEQHGGTLVKELDDRLLAAFPQATSAVQAALALQESQAAVAADAPQLRLAAHRGMAMTASINGQLDYFGQTVLLTNRLLENSELPFVLSQELAEDHDCCQLLTAVRCRLSPALQIGEMPTFEVCRDASEENANLSTSSKSSAGDATAVLESVRGKFALKATP